MFVARNMKRLSANILAAQDIQICVEIIETTGRKSLLHISKFFRHFEKSIEVIMSFGHIKAYNK
jgi:hypothetical protein